MYFATSSVVHKLTAFVSPSPGKDCGVLSPIQIFGIRILLIDPQVIYEHARG